MTVRTGSDLFFLRHGQTDWNRDGRFQGAADIPLNDVGRAQSTDHGKLLHRQLIASGWNPDQIEIHSSPLGRAMETASIVGGCLSGREDSIKQKSALRELSFGEWEGMTTLEVKAAFPVARKARKADRWGFAPPGGESPQSREPELKKFLEGLTHPVVIVTHTGIIRICLSLLGVLERNTALLEPISQDKIYRISKGSLARI